jgi:starch synthase
MKICFACSEVVPLAKTGGLADVCGALPIELQKLGHQVSLFLPAYRSAKQSSLKIKSTGVSLQISVGPKLVTAEILTTQLPDSDVSVYLVDQPAYFDRPQLYGEAGRDYPDNCERFVFFCRAVLEAIRVLRLDPEILHAHDWQTGLLPTYLKTDYAGTPPYDQLTSVFTIHNLAYQGRFWHWDMLLTGLDWKHFNWRELEFYGQLNLLKAGIVFADALSTVSPTYAREIQTAEQGCGLEGVLIQRADVLTGILNGIDTSIWNPSTDPALPKKYDLSNWREGKAACKAALQQQLGLEVRADCPLIGAVGRMVSQKGWSLILPVMQQWLATIDAQWVVLGTGEPEYEYQISQLRKRFPNRLSVNLKFADELAHQIEAASDIFLMPSQYEPCGLNQMYSMAYGAVPVVRSTGGLYDTVIDATPYNLERNLATGFSFSPFLAESLEQALARAVCSYHNQPKVWAQLVEAGMASNWSWSESARKYEQLYERAICLRLSRTGTGSRSI